MGLGYLFVDLLNAIYKKAKITESKSTKDVEA